MVDLDAVIRRARSATVRREAAEAYVRDFERSTSDSEVQRAASHSPDLLGSPGSPSSPDSPSSSEVPGSPDVPDSSDSRGSRWLPWAPWSRGSRGYRPDESNRPRWLVRCLAAAAAVTAIAVGFALVSRDAAPRTVAAVRIGDRVAIVAEPGTVYRIVRAGGDETAIEIERGEVTARLWPGPRAHRLTLQGGGVVALAQGTVYSLAVERGTGAVQVDEGTVEVRVGAEIHRVPAGASWPPDRPRGHGRDGRDRGPVLTALAATDRRTQASPSTPSSSIDNAPPSMPSAPHDNASAANGSVASTPSSSVSTSVSSTSARPAASPASTAPSTSSERASAVKPSPAITPPSTSRSIATLNPPRAPTDRVTLETTPPRRASSDLKQRWQLARRLRAEGKLRLAIGECLAIADLHDSTWSPIALVEVIRLYAGPLTDPAHAIAIADRVIAEWPADVLVPEARQLRCRALARLGRGQECAVPPTP